MAGWLLFACAVFGVAEGAEATFAEDELPCWRSLDPADAPPLAPQDLDPPSVALLARGASVRPPGRRAGVPPTCSVASERVDARHAHARAPPRR